MLNHNVPLKARKEFHQFVKSPTEYRAYWAKQRRYNQILRRVEECMGEKYLPRMLESLGLESPPQETIQDRETFIGIVHDDLLSRRQPDDSERSVL